MLARVGATPPLMATYAIGDIHGCREPLERLLGEIDFGKSDRLWLVGDLVNRGPESAQVLRWAKGLGERAVAVLGNHDIHLLARAAGVGRARRRDTLDDILAASDRDELLAWLRARPLLHRERSFVLVHAGLLPSWTLAQADALARQGEEALRGPAGDAVLGALDGTSGAPRGIALVVEAIRTFCSLRTCTTSGAAAFDFDGPPAAAPRDQVPWFAAAKRGSAQATVIFGHWAALGLAVDDKVVALDSGCVWGGALSAYRLDDGRVFQVPAR